MNRLCRQARPITGVALALLLAAALPVAAQQAAGSSSKPTETFGTAIDVSVVNLDVFVTDKKGKPVTGLRQEDFEILEDGKPVAISNFYAERRGTLPTPAPATVPAAPGAPAPAAVERPVAQRLRLVVLVDDVNLSAANRKRILENAGKFLHTELQPGDEVMVVRYDQKLDIRRQFTADLKQVDADFAAILKLPTDVRHYDRSLATAISSVSYSVVGDSGYGATAEGALASWAGEESIMVQGALDALDSVVSWLAGVPGRKAILYVSDGLPLVPGLDLFTIYSRAPVSAQTYDRTPEMSAQKYDLTTRFRQMTAHASRNRVVLYPIEAYGTRNVSGVTLFDAVALVNRQNGLRFLAEDTGGRALLNAADVPGALARVAEDFETYYSIGYQPQRPADEAEHKIEVQAKPRGLQVRTRQWYRDKPEGETVAEGTLAVMRFGPEDNPLGVGLEIVPGKKAGEMLVRVKVPVAKLFLAPQEGSREGRLRLYVVASGEGSTTPVRQTKLVTVDVPEAEAAAGANRDYTHEIAIPLKPGSYALGVGVRDELSTTTSYLRRDFMVGEGESAAKR